MIDEDDTVQVCTQDAPATNKTQTRVIHPDAEVVTSSGHLIGLRCPYCGVQWWEVDEG